MIDRTRRFLSSAGWLSAINFAQAVLLLAVSIVLARSILPGVFGLFAYLPIFAAAGLLLVPGQFFPYLLLLCGKAGFMLAGVHTILLQRDYRFGLGPAVRTGAGALPVAQTAKLICVS